MRYAYVNRSWAQSINGNQNGRVQNSRRTTFNSLSVQLTSRLNTQEKLPAIILSNDEAAAIAPSEGVPFLPDLRRKERVLNAVLKEAFFEANLNHVHYLYAHIDALKAAVSFLNKNSSGVVFDAAIKKYDAIIKEKNADRDLQLMGLLARVVHYRNRMNANDQQVLRPPVGYLLTKKSTPQNSAQSFFATSSTSNAHHKIADENVSPNNNTTNHQSPCATI